MARYGGRSKACANCRRAKKKCDELYPQCGTCVATNKKCSGSVQGNIFLNANASSVNDRISKQSSISSAERKRRRALTKQQNSACSSVPPCQNEMCSAIIIPGRGTEEEHTHEALGKELHCVPLYDIQVISNLVYYYSESVQLHNGHNKKPQSWLMQLPDMAQNTSLHTIRAPLLAPSLLLLALQSRQYTVLKEALKWYHLGLKYVRKRLKHLDIKESDDREDKFLICAALLMSFYESLNDTIVGGYEQHVLGAVALLQAKGPEIFARPEYHGLFRAIRGHAIHVSLTTGNPTCLAEEAWLSIPFFHSLKSNSEKINDILLLMPSYLFELRAKLSCITDLTESERIKNEFMQKLSHILEALDGMQIPIAQLENPSPYFSNKYYTDLDDQSLDYYRGSYSFSTAIEAKEIAMHASARIIILCILSSVTLSSSLSSASCFVIQSYYGDEDITREIEQASTSILSAAMFLSQVEIGCAYVRMVLPLQLVAQVSRNHTQRTAARTILQSWWKEKPIKGLTGLALRSIDSGSSNLLEILSV